MDLNRFILFLMMIGYDFFNNDIDNCYFMLILEWDCKEYINVVIDINLLILYVLGILFYFLNLNSLDLWVFF